MTPDILSKNFLLSALFLICVSTVHGQTEVRTAISEMVDSEIAFSAMARSHNTRDAFLHFLSDSAVTFGERPRVGKDHLLKQDADSSWLFWFPLYAEISASNNFGYTYGGWEYRNAKQGTVTDLTPVATGQFLSVWKKEGDQWRVALDVGIDHPSHTYSKEERKVFLSKHVSHVLHPGDLSSVLETEKQFIHEFQTHAVNAYKKHITGNTKFFRSGLMPFSYEKIKQDNVAYDLINGEISPSGDLAFVYGTARWSREETPAENHDANYVRIWKKDGTQWKIVADLLSDR
jgi:ketosteroid isomerase-like protein